MNTPAGGLAWPHDNAAVAVLDSVAARLQADPGAMVEAAMTTVAAEADVLRDETRVLAGQLTDLVRHRRRLTPGEVERIEALGAVRAARGLPLEELQRAARTALDGAWRHLVGLIPAAPDSAPSVRAVARLAEEVFDFVQQATEAMLRGHAAHHRLGALQRDRSAGGDIVDHLFDGAGELAQGARDAGLDLSVPHGLVLFAGTGDDDADEAHLRHVLAEFAARVPASLAGTIRAEPAAHAVVGVPVPAPEAWATAMATADAVAADHDVVALAVGPTRGAGGLFGCYGDAAALVPVVQRVGPVAAVRRPDDLGTYRFLASVGPEEARVFVEGVLGPLLDLPQPERGDALRRLATLPTDGDDDGLARIRIGTALALLRRYPELDGGCPGTGASMDERTLDADDGNALDQPAPAPEGDLADEGGPTQAGAERGETPDPPTRPTT